MDKQKQDEKKNMYLLIALCILLFIIIVVTGVLFVKQKKAKEDFAYTELIKQINEQEIEKIEMTVGSTKIKVKQKGVEEEESVIIPSTQAFVELIQTKVETGNEIELVQKDAPFFTKMTSSLFALLPTLMMVVLVVLIIKMQGLGDKGKIYDGKENTVDVRFKDVAGLDEEKTELEEIVQFLKEPKRFEQMGAKVPKGVLLYGKPGTGKTLIAKAIAGEANVPFISMSGSEFIEMFAGLGASRVRKLFERARKLAPCIVFIDEIDAIGSRRTSQSGAESENNQTLNQLLVEMDGFEKNGTIIVLAATNRPEMLDKALLRPGRFDRQITINAPDVKGREEILKIHSKGKKFADNITLKGIAEDTAGYTGAELANILNEAAIVATVNNHTVIEQADLEEAVKKVSIGLQKNSRVISEKERKLTAYHEAGHAIVGRFLDTAEDLKEISIIPRGFAGGYTMYKTNEDKFYKSKTELEEKLVGLFGGRAAEKLALNDISTGARNDIEVATQIATDMVTIYGMSEKLGPISLEKDEKTNIFGEGTEEAVGEEIRQLINQAYVGAQQILKDNFDKLHLVAGLLLERETITAEEFEECFKN